MGTCEVDVLFAPTAAGTFTSTLTLESNSPTQTVAFTGTGQSAQPPTPRPQILPSPQVILPDTSLGTTSSVTVQLANAMTATAPLIVSGISFTGSNANDFSQTNNCTAAPIPANGSCSITITFNPLALGARSTTLTIASNAVDFGGATVSGNAVNTVNKFSLTTSITGTGSIQQSPAGNSFAANTTITLTPVASGNNVVFGSWSSGPCAGTANSPCIFQITANTSATAGFFQQFTVMVVSVGLGNVSPPGPLNFSANQSISLSAVPLLGASFVSWSGVCPGSTNPICTFTVTANVTATATFTNQVRWGRTSWAPAQFSRLRQAELLLRGRRSN